MAMATVATPASEARGQRRSSAAPQSSAATHQRQAHHVQDVDLQEADGRTEAEHEATGGGTRTPGRRSCTRGAAAHAWRRARGTPRRSFDAPDSAVPRPGQEQERRRRQAADEGGPVEGRAVAVGVARPRVDDVREHHQDHGDAAHPVEPRPARPRARPLVQGTTSNDVVEHDVLPQRMPDRAVLVVRERDRPLDGVRRRVAVQAEVQRDGREAARAVRGRARR